MTETNIWLNIEDKRKLTKISQQKQLSISTICDIIVKNYFVIANSQIYTEFINKGDKQTHIKLRNSNKNTLTPMIITNCIYLYLHNEQIPQEINYKKLNRTIQSEFDKTIDHNYMRNQLIRATWRIKTWH